MTTEKKKDENKAPGWAWWVLIIISIIIAVIFTGISKKEEVAGAGKASTQNWQLCTGDYNFSNENLPATIKIDIRTDCWAPVTLPPNINFRTHVDADMKIIFVDGAEFIDGPDKQVWYGEFRREIFRVRGIQKAGTLEIFMEQKI